MILHSLINLSLGLLCTFSPLTELITLELLSSQLMTDENLCEATQAEIVYRWGNEVILFTSHSAMSSDFLPHPLTDTLGLNIWVHTTLTLTNGLFNAYKNTLWCWGLFEMSYKWLITELWGVFRQEAKLILASWTVYAVRVDLPQTAKLYRRCQQAYRQWMHRPCLW